LLPGVVLAPLVLLLLFAATVLTWSAPVLESAALPWPGFVVSAMAKIYDGSSSWFFGDTVYGLAAVPMKWVFLVHLVIAIWLAAARRLTPGRATRLGLQVLVLWFATTQYYVNLTGLAEQRPFGSISAFLVALMLLWLLYRVGLPRTFGSSRGWPSIGRLLVFAAILVFIMLEIHARSALRDRSALDRVFYYMFRGVLDFGLPYYLLIFATRRVEALTVPVPRLLTVYALGAVAALLFNAADRIVAAGGFGPTLSADLAARLDAVLAGDREVLASLWRSPPALWTIARSALAVGLPALVGIVALRRKTGPVGVLYLVVGTAAGLASFRHIRLDLPGVPPELNQLFAPARSSVEIDYHLFALNLTHLLPALVFGLILAAGRRRLALAFLAAFVLHAAASLLWPGREAWLESTGLSVTIGVAAAGAMLLLLRLTREWLVPPREEDDPPLLRWPGVLVASLLIAFVLLSAGVVQLVRGHLEDRDVGGAVVGIPAAWTSVGPRSYVRPTLQGIEAKLSVLYRPDAATAGQALLSWIDEEGVARAGFEPFGEIRRWNRHGPGTLALRSFSTEAGPGGLTIHYLGTLAATPHPAGGYVLFDLRAPMASHDRREWDLKYMAEALR
jgi:hypothetical protein